MAMDQQQPLKEPELRNRIIRRVDGLETFFTRNTNANVGGLPSHDHE